MSASFDAFDEWCKQNGEPVTNEHGEVVDERPVPVRVRFDQLRPGDEIVCPGSGMTERVTRSYLTVGTAWFLRTNRHDHLSDRSRTVEVAR